MNVSNETKQQFYQIFSFFCVVGGGGGGGGAIACAIKTTKETLTTYKCCVFETSDSLLKTPLALLSHLDLVLSFTRFLFLSEKIICSVNNNELRNAPTPKLFISCTGQCPVFYNNLRTPGSFGTFSHCSDEVSRQSCKFIRTIRNFRSNVLRGGNVVFHFLEVVS